jgi:ketosteroid isomerase-like protein
VTTDIALPPCGLGRAAPAWLSEFYNAYLSADAKRLDAVMHDDVVWLISGPADQVDIFGMRRGKEEVIELITRIIPCFQQVTGFEVEQLLVQGDRAASFGRVRSLQRETRRQIRFGYAHFMRFQDGKLISMRALADSFDAVEQLMGYQITVVSDASLVPEISSDELSMI